MDAEEYLDHLIDQQVSGENQLSPTDEEIAALLAAAQMLLQLQEIAIPPEAGPPLRRISSCSNPPSSSAVHVESLPQRVS